MWLAGGNVGDDIVVAPRHLEPALLDLENERSDGFVAGLGDQTVASLELCVLDKADLSAGKHVRPIAIYVDDGDTHCGCKAARSGGILEADHTVEVRFAIVSESPPIFPP